MIRLYETKVETNVDINPINLNDFGTIQLPIIDSNQYDIPSFLKPEESKILEETPEEEKDDN